MFAAASDTTMKAVTDAGLAAGAPTVFATNVLQIATAPGNPRGVAAFADLARPDLKVVVCAPQVPCGAATDRIEKATGVTLAPVSEEADVKSTLGKVTSGDADAGGHDVPPGLSIRTFVDLITATASTPGSSPSSRTASLLISDTTRCGPHCISTWAITLSVITSVTSPTSRLRAERPTSEGS